MKQVLLRQGKVFVSDVPAPALAPRNILVEVSHSLISAGTEVSTVQASRLKTADALKVIDSLKVRGVRRTLAIIQNKRDEARPLGYSCAGTVLAVGEEVTEFQAGDRVACAGAGIANHADVVSVPVNLAVRVPGGLDGASACFVTLGAIALQGVRRADLRLGETVVIIGLGLIGQLAAQLAVAAGCRVIGMDTDAVRAEAALKLGVAAAEKDPAALAEVVSQLTDGLGADATLITASSESSEPTRLSFHLTRKKGRIVVVGAVGMNLERSPFYEKEQDFLISCSYGPGRYDPAYEAEGHDYPFPYVRWTENRNMAAFLSLIADGRVRTDILVEKTFPVDQAEAAYAALEQTRRPLAIVLSYPSPNGAASKMAPIVSVAEPRTAKLRLGLVGVGAFVKSTHLPSLRALDSRVQVTAVCASTSASAATVGRQLNASIITTDHRALLKEGSVDALLISTRHDDHAAMANDALGAGKHVYLEKPLALTATEIDELERTMTALARSPILMVGYNRRFAPHTETLRETLTKRTGPLVASYRVNAGRLPASHWAQGPHGGGRLRGEACHMIDFFQAVVGHPIIEASVLPLRSGGAAARPDENFCVQLGFQDGSVCDLVYTSVGDPSLPKERVEVHWDGHSAVIDDFRKLTIHGRTTQTGAQDKGHVAALETFVDAIAEGTGFPIPWPDMKASAQLCIDLDARVWGKLGAAGAES